jgi:microcin C transport system permease protein
VDERFKHMMGNYLRGEFGKSYFKDRRVIDLIKEKLPVSIRLGLIMLFLTYLIAIPLGIRKAVKDGTPFDAWTSSVLVFGYAIPGFIFAVLLIVFFAGGSFLQIFPLRGLRSEYYNELSLVGKILDQAWHLVLPIFALGVGAFTTLAFMTKNSFLDEIKKQYVTTARAKGLSERRVLYGHVFRNAMLIIIAGMPAAFVSAFLTGSLLIETIFSLDGLGLLGFESLITRDYPVVYGTLFIFSLVGLVVHVVTDFVYTLVDPRIDFDSREV